jgi:hypothetical protein
MPKNTEIFFTKTTRAKPTDIVAADSTSTKLIFNPSIEGSRLEAIVITSTSNTQRTLLLELKNENTQEVAQLGHITIPAQAGQGSVNAVSGLNRGNLPWMQIDANGNPYINLNFNMNIQARLTTALTGSEKIMLTCLGADYDA